jgi:hypothetical protein
MFSFQAVASRQIADLSTLYDKDPRLDAMTLSDLYQGDVWLFSDLYECFP